MACAQMPPIRQQTPPPPIPLNASEQVLAGLARILEQYSDSASRARPEMVYEKFRKMGPPEFFGSTDPFVVERWIRSLEVIFKYMDLADADRVRCVTFPLKEDASFWWEGAEKTLDMVTLDWAGFKRVFYDKYFTPDVQAKLKREFWNLRQGDMSVAEYVKKFDRGCHFSPLIANNEAEKLQHFLDGLLPSIRRDVLMVDPADYTAAQKMAYRSEQTLKDINAEAQGKRPYPQQNQQQHKHKHKRPHAGPPRQQGPPSPAGPQRSQGQQAQRPGVQPLNDKPFCKDCKRHHFGKCLAGAEICFKCKQPGHMATDCPQRL